MCSYISPLFFTVEDNDLVKSFNRAYVYRAMMISDSELCIIRYD